MWEVRKEEVQGSSSHCRDLASALIKCPSVVSASEWTGRSRVRRVPPRAGGILLVIVNAHAVRLHKAMHMQSFLKPASLEHLA